MMTSKASSTAPRVSAAGQISGFIAKFDPKIQRRIRSCRAALRKRLPTAVELVYDNYNFLVFGFGPSERPSEAILSLAAYARGVGLAFLRGASLPDPQKILKGSGKLNRFVPLASASDLASPALEALIRAALRQSETPLPERGRGRTVIRSISARQRPRRAATRP